MAQCKNCLHYQVCAWCVDANNCSFFKPKNEIVKDISDLKKVVHDSAVFPLGKDEYSYVSLKVINALLQNLLNKYTEGENGRRKVDKDNN